MIKKIILAAFILTAAVLPAAAEDYNIDDGIFLSEANMLYSIVVNPDESIPLSSPYERGRITRYSTDVNNPTGLGRFIEVEYQMGFEFENTFMKQGEIKLIFSNIKSIDAGIAQELNQGDKLCTSLSGPDGGLRVFILSETDELRFLQMWTNDRKFEIDSIWYWDPSYLFN